MRYLYLLLIGIVTVNAGCASSTMPGRTGHKSATTPETMHGFMDLNWHPASGQLHVAIEQFDTRFLYQSALARGIGSNDIGLDRGQLGATRVVSFVRSGPKILLLEHNLTYRATSDNPFEQRAIDESFAQSVVWGFTVLREEGATVWVDATEFFLRDAHGLSAALAAQGHGSFQPDPGRSGIFLPRTKAFPDNTEIEARVTFTGQPAGNVLPTVVPDPTAITVHMHHSFVRLPGPGYAPLAYDPRSGFIDADFYGGYFDYGVPIAQPTARAFTRRHRLAKRDPSAAHSEAVEPIIYYVDRGAPELVRSALMDGASWWNDAFAAAGYRNAFVVKLLPEDADPLDVRFNVIQWVHRSTRGWSYGSSVVDPRTGEIIKGHVTLGSLRVRQDFLLAEGLLSPWTDERTDPRMQAMALARIRQLSAHEVGHTLGLEHNFAGSANGRSSVMDYPFPLLSIDGDGHIDVSAAYASGIGSWDKRAIAWGYTDMTTQRDPAQARNAILNKTYQDGHLFVADRHARAVGSMHPDGSLWDNGSDPLAELAKLQRVRRIALTRMSASTIQRGRPLATIEEALVPMYLLHRYQIEAVGKLIGGARFNYALRGDGQTPIMPVTDARQRAALAALLGTLASDELALPDALLAMLPARPPGFAPTRELFARHTGDAFDIYAPARAYADLCVAVLLDPARAARLVQTANADPSRLGFHELTQALVSATWFAKRHPGNAGAYQRIVNEAVLEKMLALANDAHASGAVRAIAFGALNQLDRKLAADGRRDSGATAWASHDQYLRAQMQAVLREPGGLVPPVSVPPPPGSPIGDAR